MRKARYGESVLRQREEDMKRRDKMVEKRMEEDKMIERHFRKLDAVDAREVVVPLPILYN